MVHTVHHCDELKSDVFFRELGIHTTDANLAVVSGSHV